MPTPPTQPIPSDPRQAYAALVTELREVSLFGSVGAVLSWDEQTFMPPGAAEHRADQASLVARVTHERATAPRNGDLLAAVEQSDLVDDPESDAAVNVRVARREYDRATKLPAALVEEMARTEVLAQQAWAGARKRSDYAAFRPWLEKVLALKRQECACVGYADDPYDALLDQYEPGETAASVRATFEALRGPLVELVGRIVGSGNRPRCTSCTGTTRPPPRSGSAGRRRRPSGSTSPAAARRVDPPVQHAARPRRRPDHHPVRRGELRRRVLQHPARGRARAVQPGAAGRPLRHAARAGRVTRHPREPEPAVGEPRRPQPVVLAIHAARTREAFPQALAGVGDDDWHFAVNDVRPSLIRTESDEVTYNLHVLLRFELERALLREELSPADLPAAWNARMKQYLGVEPPTDAVGCLQDIHWAGGAIGYFPTYTLGNLYAAQFFEQARADLGDLDAQFARGEFRPLLDWLRQHVHGQGMKYPPRQLGRRVTGQDLQPAALLAHLRRRRRSSTV
jgi:carboxypeptidase Taq